MITYDPRDFALELEGHLKVRDEIEKLDSFLKSRLESIFLLDNRISETSKLCDKLQSEISKLKKEYDSHNFNYGLGEAHRDFTINKKLRNETWTKIYEAGKERDGYYEKMQEIQSERDLLLKKVGDNYRKFKTSNQFYELHEKRVALYSIVSVDFMGKVSKFILLTEYQRAHISLSSLDIYSVDSPLGKACVGKRIEQSFSYTVPSGAELTGKILECALPSLEQMEQIISKLNRAIVSSPSVSLNLNSWTSNNTRYQKGG
jgi:transcription elongation GreA/GreB family factor